jgi:hypothetical protein
MDDTRSLKLAQFVDWVRQHIKGDEKGEAQIYLDRLFQGFSQQGVLEAGGSCEFRLRKRGKDSRGTAFADLVWKPIVLIEMKKRGEDLRQHFRQAFDYWIGSGRRRKRVYQVDTRRGRIGAGRQAWSRAKTQACL